MTKIDAQAVAAILLKADNGCPVCTKALLELFCKQFPEHAELAERAHREEFGRCLDGEE